MLKRIAVVFILSFFFTDVFALPKIRYTLSFPQPQTHYVKVKMEISDWDSSFLDLKMPVWTPGSYLVREYARFVEGFSATAKGTKLPSAKFRKNGWKVSTQGQKDIVIEYDLYAYELTVRTSFIDEEHAYLNGASVFLYINGYLDLPGTVEVVPFSKWKKISVALQRSKEKNPWELKFTNFDELADSPFEIGNQEVFHFTAAGVKHEVAMVGATEYDSVKIKKDLTVIAEECFAIFGEHPCTSYLYIVHNLYSGGGGLEHSNSTTIQVNRNTFTTGNYNGFLSLAAHEYFHLWNVKRLRPAPLGPFDYDNEIYTNLLYMAEGFTSYYDELLLLRGGFVSVDNYLSTLAGSISSIENTPGNSIQSVAEASYDAWIKYYRSTENSGNSTISYYTKGSVIAALIDIAVCNATEGRKSLDDVLKYMYDEYYKKLNRGFTDDELIAAVEKICNCSMKSFFSKYIYSTDEIPYNDFFAMAGLKLTDKNIGKDSPYLGVAVSTAGNKVVITNVDREGPSWAAGLNVNDEIISVNDIRVGEDFLKFIAGRKANEKLLVKVSRAGLVKEFAVTLIQTPKVTYQVEKLETLTPKQKAVHEKWLGIKP